MDRCRYCQTAILERTRAVLEPEGFLLDFFCAAELARAGELSQVQIPIVRGGAVVGYLPAFWSEHLGGFITIAEREE